MESIEDSHSIYKQTKKSGRFHLPGSVSGNSADKDVI